MVITRTGFLAACAGAGFGLLVGYAAPSWGIDAQLTVGKTPAEKAGAAGGVDAKSVTVAQLQAQLTDLTARIATLEADKDKPVKAPFNIVNDAGHTIMSVTDDPTKPNEGAVLTLGEGASTIQLAAGGIQPTISLNSFAYYGQIQGRSDGMHLELGKSNKPYFKIEPDQQGMTMELDASPNGDTKVAFSAAENNALVSAVSGKDQVDIGKWDDGAGLRESSGGKDLAVLGDVGGPGKYALAISSESGGPLFQAGNQKSGKPGMSIFDGDNPIVRIESGSSAGAGQIKVFDGGKEAAGLGKLDDNNIGLRVTEDKEIFFAGKGKEGSELSLSKGSDKLFVVNVSAEKSELQLGKPEDSANWRMSTKGDQGGAELALSESGSEVAKLGAIKGTGTLALSEAGAPSITLGPTEAKANPALRVYDKGAMALTAGVTPSGTGAVVAYDRGKIGAGIEAAAGGNGAVYVTSNGKEVASINSTDKPGEGMAVVRTPSGVAVARLGYGSAGGGNLQVTDPSGNGVFSAGYVADNGPGAACVEHNGTKCLGIGLTGMEGFH